MAPKVPPPEGLPGALEALLRELRARGYSPSLAQVAYRLDGQLVDFLYPSRKPERLPAEAERAIEEEAVAC